MAFIIYNEIASAYNKYRRTILARAKARYKHLDSQELQEKIYPIWKQLEEQKPEDFDYFGCPENIAMWLNKIMPEFHFPNEGLSGKAKVLLIKKLKELAMEYRDDTNLTLQLTNLYKFLEKYPIVFGN